MKIDADGVTSRSPGWRSSTVRSFIPVRNDAHTPPGTAVSAEGPAEDSAVMASRRPVLAPYSDTQPLLPDHAETYRYRPAGSTEALTTVRPAGSLIVATVAPVLASSRSSVRW